MAQTTAISWTDLTWNPTFGCSRVSEGCGQPSGGGCYAEAIALRFGQSSKPWTERNAAENVLLKPHKLREPLSNAKAWRGLGDAARAAGKTDGMLVFVNSMSDLFHEQIPYEYIDEVFRIMERAQRHTFQVLTKRPERMAEVMADLYACGLGCGDVLPNVWLGVSIENRKWVGRADVLREVPAAVRFISAEPLLGPLLARFDPDGDLGEWVWPDGTTSSEGGLDLTRIDWLIAGGESGPNYRPMDLQWMRDLRDACAASGTAFFAKQIASSRPGVDPPADLLIREFPAVPR